VKTIVYWWHELGIDFTYYRLINEGVRDRLGGLHSQIVLYSVDFHEIEQFSAPGKWDEAGCS